MGFVIAIAALTSGLTLFYVLLIRYFIRGWNKIETQPRYMPGSSETGFSVIIAARNEENNISACLRSIVAQHYPSSGFEIIVVDDHSEDGTSSQVESFINQHPDSLIRLLKLTSQSGKKKAIEAGIAASTNEWIITTDADCTMGENWLPAIAAYLQNQETVLLSAPVRFRTDSSFIQRAQALEFMGLVGIGAASIQQGSPNMCNGANLVYSKAAFKEVDGFAGVDHLASGDDELLMHKMARKWPGKIHFLADKQAVVYTMPNLSLYQFIQQRKRWVSKSRQYADSRITNVLIASYLFHLFLLVSCIAGFFSPVFFGPFLIGFGSKLLVEYLFLRNVSDFFGGRSLLRLLVPSAFLYMLYVVFIGIYGNFGKYRWKGRTVS